MCSFLFRKFAGRVAFGFLLFVGYAGAYTTDANVSQASNYYTFQPPAVGAGYTDPMFGTSITRISNALATANLDSGGNLIFVNNEYSTMTPFNQDNSKILLAHQSYFALYDASGNFLSVLPFEINTSSEPRWSRTDAGVLFYHFINQLRQYNVATGAISTVRTFSEYSSISGLGESDISLDGNHLVLVGDHRYVFVYELSTNTKGPALDTAGRGFDSVYITPYNNVTITWLQAGTGRYNGIELFDRNMNFLRQVAHAGGHMDVTLDTDGSEVLVWTNSNDALPLPGCNNGFVKINLSTAQQTCLLSLDWSLAVHISGTDNSGWVFAETYAPSDPSPDSLSWVPYTNEILQIKLDGTETRRLLHHRSRPFNSYNWMPRVSVSRDGSRFLYTSNYGLQAILGDPNEYSDVYLVIPPAGGSGTGANTGGATTGTGTGSTAGDGGGSATGTGGTSTTTTTTIRTEQNSLDYGTGWYTVSQSIFSGGSAAEAMDAGSRATFSFTGTGVRWLGYRDEWSGVAKVYLDGQLQATVDTFASPSQAQALIWGTSGLSAGSHTLIIEATGTQSAASAGRWIWIDVLEVDTTTTTSGDSSDTPSSSGGSSNGEVTLPRIEQDSSAINYGGAWYQNQLPVHSRGSATMAMERGASATVDFLGTGVSWIGYRDQWSGIARVYLDGKPVAKIDTYSATDTAQTPLYTVAGLTAGNHRLVIEVTGQKSRSSAGAWVWVDAFDVIP